MQPAYPPCRKEALGPFIAAEAQELHKEGRAFGATVEAFRKKFLDAAPMSSNEPLLPATVCMVLGVGGRQHAPGSRPAQHGSWISGQTCISTFASPQAAHAFSMLEALDGDTGLQVRGV